MPNTILPVEIVFHPHWWYRNCGIRFDRDFFFDPETRIEANLLMRRYLHERFPDLGLVEKDPQPRPMVGGTMLAAGFIISSILGCEILFRDDASPEVLPANLDDARIEQLQAPEIKDAPLMQDLIRLFIALEDRFGYVEGDINWEGVQNVALDLRGPQLFLDYCVNPRLAKKVLDTVFNVITQFLDFMTAKTGTTSISVNRIVRLVDPRLYLHSNCTVTMISPDHYREYLLRYDQMFAERYQPFGIHYCGGNMETMRFEFAGITGASFFDVGWGSDVSLCRQVFPDKFLSLRMSPVRMMSLSAAEISDDVESLLNCAGPLHLTGLCCVNVDYGVPDENIRSMFRTAEKVRQEYTRA